MQAAANVVVLSTAMFGSKKGATKMVAMISENAWGAILERIRASVDPDEFRRWFSMSSQASDSGDQITVWVPASSDARHIEVHYLDRIRHELERMDRPNVNVRFVATGYEDDEDQQEE
jgi:chromosomal replication initiation ATPase DnaA